MTGFSEFRLCRRGVEIKLVSEPPGTTPPTDNKRLISLVADAHKWWRLIVDGKVNSINEIGALEGIDPSDVGRSLQLAFLAPVIVEAIVLGRHPVELTTQNLRRHSALPFAWEQQSRLLGFRG